MNGKALLLVLLGGSSMAALSSGWDDLLDPVAIITEAVASKRQPILRVTHEEGHGGWQFYDDAEPLTVPVVMSKDQFLALDPSLASLKDLPVGWEAIRENRSGKWLRSRAQP